MGVSLNPNPTKGGGVHDNEGSQEVDQEAFERQQTQVTGRGERALPTHPLPVSLDVRAFIANWKEGGDLAKHMPSIWHRPFLTESGVSRMLDEMFADFSDVGFDVLPSFGRTDVYEKDGCVVYEMELPGIRKDEVEIKVDQGRVAVSGEIKRSEEIKQEDYFRIGRRYGRFYRSLPLPSDVKDERSISASLKDGILKVSVPLATSIKERAKPIDIKIE